MTSDQLQTISKAFSVSHLLDIFIQLAPYVLVIASILLAASVIRHLIFKLRIALIKDKYSLKDDPYVYFEEDRESTVDSDYMDEYLGHLEDWIETSQNNPSLQSERRAQAYNREYKNLTGDYYVDPEDLHNSFALRRG